LPLAILEDIVAAEIASSTATTATTATASAVLLTTMVSEFERIGGWVHPRVVDLLLWTSTSVTAV
jgi:hypothetical protein